MRTIITTIVCILASLAAVNGAAAQTHSVRVVIPFDFSASGSQLPAGTYTIANQYGLTWITKSGSREATYLRATPATDSQPDDSRVVFSISDGQIFLQKILCPQINMSLELLPSKSAIRTQAHRVSNQGN